MFRRLIDIKGKLNPQLLTIRVIEAYLIKEPVETLYVNLNDDLEVITNSQGVQEHFKETDAGWLQKRFEEWEKPEVREVRIATPEHPLEVLDTAICLILSIEGRDYIPIIYRDIYPKGWVIPGGRTKNLREIFSPELCAIRELSEEVLIVDTKGRIYYFYPSATSLIEEHVQKRGLKPTEEKSLYIERLAFPKKGNVQNLVVEMNGKERKARDVNIFIDSQTATTTAAFYWKLNLPVPLEELKVFDGERGEDGSLLDRETRLTEVNKPVEGWCLPALRDMTTIP